MNRRRTVVEGKNKRKRKGRIGGRRDLIIRRKGKGKEEEEGTKGKDKGRRRKRSG